MKKLITIITLITLTFSTVNAQVKKPAISVKNKKLKKEVLEKGLNISNLKIRSLKDIEKLTIPDAAITKEFSNFRPVRTWKINPSKIRDGKLRLYYFKGQQFENCWYFNKYFTNLYPQSGLVPPELHRDVGLFYDTSLEGGGGLTPPLVLKFLASKNVRYLLKFKVENRQIHDRKIAVLIDDHISYVRLNNHNEFIYAFTADTTKEIKIGIGGLYSHYNTEFLKIVEIKVDQIAIR